MIRGILRRPVERTAFGGVGHRGAEHSDPTRLFSGC